MNILNTLNMNDLITVFVGSIVIFLPIFGMAVAIHYATRYTINRINKLK